MKGMVVAEYGAPLVERDLAAPVLAPGHALLEVLTCGVCFSDVKIARGRMPFSDDLALPHVPGHEICGRVVKTDPAGALAPGTRGGRLQRLARAGAATAAAPARSRSAATRSERAGFTDPGGFRERIAVPLDRLLEVPDAHRRRRTPRR